MPRATARHHRRIVLLAAVLLLAVGGPRLVPRATPAAAAVGHRSGYHATVDGFTSWYGSYDLGDIGTAWCVDHGIRAPDPALGYVPTTLDTPADLQAAVAWAMGRHGVAPDRPTSAALMLVAHDLMGATYPSGDFDVDWIDTRWLAGFGGDAAAVLARAQAIKADALTHATLRPPWVLELTANDPPLGETGVLAARVTAGGMPVAGVELVVVRSAFEFDAATVPTTLTTGADGTVAQTFVASDGPYRFEVTATVPDLRLQAFAPTTAPAQRVVRAATESLVAGLDRVGLAPTTTTTTTSTTSTTAPPTTTTTSTTSTTSTSTTAPPTTTTTSTTLAPATTSTTSVELPTTTTALPTSTPVTVVGTATPRTLPRTGTDPVGWTCIGSGLVLLGAAIRPRRGATSRSDNPQRRP